MPISADTHAIIHGGKSIYLDDPAELLPGWPGTGAVLQSRKMNFTLTNLGTTTKIYTSDVKSDIKALAEFYANLGATIDLEEGPVYRLTVNLPYDELFNLDQDPLKFALWEVTPQAVERDIYLAGIYAPSSQGGQLSSVPLTVPLVIRQAIEQAARNPNFTVDLTQNQKYAQYNFLAQNFLALKRLKADAVQGFTQTVKRTLIVNINNKDLSFDPITEGDPDSNRRSVLLSQVQFITLYNVPEAIQKHLLPSYVIQKTVTDQDPVTVNGLAGYLAKKPVYQQVTPNKIQLTQEFVWDEWVDLSYRPYQGDYSGFGL